MATSDARGTACSWRAALDRQLVQRSARDLYKGRAFAEAQAVAARMGGALLVVSAGLGLVPADAQVPAYDLTPSDSHGEFSVAMNRAGWTLEDWWAALTVDGGIAEAVGQSDVETVLVAIPATYIAMVRADLMRAVSVQGRKVFIFTSPVGQKLLRGPLWEAAMPYDERLESLFEFAGTRSDFPQRALRHFVTELVRGHESVASGRELVTRAMGAARFRELPIRQRATDDEVRTLIQLHWDQCRGNSATLLRHLRDTLKVSCEQGRFARLRREVAGELASAARV